ncbi:polymer-forming cytoskeletal protein [candidate division KSB1 bacterium]|nr:polymer-forming cytoskeletal protein [candidate division KSB1 bacterium]
MWNKKEESTYSKSGELSTILGKDSYFEGTLELQHSLRIDGKFKGKLKTTDALYIGREGEIDGDITVKNALIGGKVIGKIIASGKIGLESKSEFRGEMKTTKLVIEEGALFEGKCSMASDDLPLLDRTMKKTPDKFVPKPLSDSESGKPQSEN